MKQRIIILVITLVILVGCQTLPRPPMKTVEYVDLERFMGDWYVIAKSLPFLKGAPTMPLSPTG